MSHAFLCSESSMYNYSCMGRSLIDKVNGLEEGGATALGPALVVCAGLASTKPRSEIILCTDGLPNIALGALDASPPDTEFYQRVR